MAADPSLDRFLSDLRTAWKEGEIRPDRASEGEAKRGRRRPDTFALVTNELQEPWRTSRELLERLQAERRDNIPISCCARCSAA